MRIERAEISGLLPHAGGMILLERVASWDQQGIVCQAVSHRYRGNPLYGAAGLHVINGIEYAAQAMAVHGCLLEGRKVRKAYIGAVSNVTWDSVWLNHAGDVLQVKAEVCMQSKAGQIYDFKVSDSARDWIQGRVVVMFDKAEVD